MTSIENLMYSFASTKLFYLNKNSLSLYLICMKYASVNALNDIVFHNAVCN